MQNKETNQKTRIKREQGHYVTYVWMPVKEGEVAKGTEKVLKSNRFTILATDGEVHLNFTRRV